MKSKPGTYLKEGPLTRITPFVSEIAGKIRGQGVDALFSIQSYLQKHLRNEDLQAKAPVKFKKLHQKRDAESILKSSYSISCTDDATAFCALARAKGIPTKYIQTVDIVDFLRRGTGSKGHVYCESYIDGKTFLLDPVHGLFIQIKHPRDYTTLFRRGTDFKVPVAEGLDNRDCGISSHDELIKKMTVEASKFLKFFAKQVVSE